MPSNHTSNDNLDEVELALSHPHSQEHLVNAAKIYNSLCEGHSITVVRQDLPVLAPGVHAGENEQTVPDFTRQILQRLPADALYVREGMVGEVHEGRWAQINTQRFRGVLHDVKVRYIKEVNGEPVTRIGFPTRDHADVVLANAPRAGVLRELRAICAHPVFTRDGRVLGPGWHPELGLLIEGFTIAAEPEPIWDVMADFGLDDIGRAGVLSLCLTMMFRPCLDGNVPLYVFTAPQERVGKSKLLNDIVGGLILGRAMPCDTWPRDEDEVRKVLVSALLSGAETLVIDNVPRKLDSAALASLVTAPMVGGRVLGKSQYVELENLLTIVATGNHVQCSQEIAKRSVVVELTPEDSEPELRPAGSFKYPDLPEAVQEARPRILRWLVDLVAAWDGKGPGWPLGGFERWAHCVGGVMRDYPLLEDRSYRIAQMNQTEEDINEFGRIWEAAYGRQWVRISSLLDLAMANQWGGERFDPVRSERSRQTTLGKILHENQGRPLTNGTRITAAFLEGKRHYRVAGSDLEAV